MNHSITDNLYEKTRMKLEGKLTIPGDKSISHRSIMFASLAKGNSEITHFLQGADCLATINCFRQMGIEIENTPDIIRVQGKGLHGLTMPQNILDVGNSGTTARLMSGILAGQKFSTTITGDASIVTRPMKRIIEPLSQMGASIRSIQQNNCAPLAINQSSLSAIQYHSQVASAQVKSAILLAGLYADGVTSVTEPYVSRNHTERMLSSFGAQIETINTTASIYPEPLLEGQQIVVPGDISSAAYFIAAALIVPNSEVMLQNVGINPTRAGILKVATMMGGNITLSNQRTISGEEVADILIKSSSLHGITIQGDLIPTLIDELPIIAIMAAVATGTTTIKDAAELKVKESNRIDLIVKGLFDMNSQIEGTDDGFVIHGGVPLCGATIDSHFDHRIAMSFTIAGLIAEGTTTILGKECVTVSYPDFYKHLAALSIKI